MKNVVLFHRNCTDGYLCWYLTYLAFSRTKQDAVFVSVNYGEPPPLDSIDPGDTVIIADFSYTEEQMNVIRTKAGFVWMIDHHSSAADNWGGYVSGHRPACVCDGAQQCAFSFNIREDRSGCGLVFDWLHQWFETFKNAAGDMTLSNPCNNSRLKWIVERVEDRDIWKFKFPESRTVHAMLNYQPYSLKYMNWLVFQASEDEFREQMLRAEGALKIRDELISDWARQAKTVRFQGMDAPILNCPANFSSDIGSVLDVGQPLAILWSASTTKAYVSLRSAAEGVNVKEIAKKFGGGGHDRAAGFSLTIAELEKLLNGEL